MGSKQIPKPYTIKTDNNPSVKEKEPSNTIDHQKNNTNSFNSNNSQFKSNQSTTSTNASDNGTVDNRSDQFIKTQIERFETSMNNRERGILNSTILTEFQTEIEENEKKYQKINTKCKLLELKLTEYKKEWKIKNDAITQKKIVSSTYINTDTIDSLNEFVCNSKGCTNKKYLENAATKYYRYEYCEDCLNDHRIKLSEYTDLCFITSDEIINFENKKLKITSEIKEFKNLKSIRMANIVAVKEENLVNDLATQFSLAVHTPPAKTGVDTSSNFFLLEHDTSGKIDSLSDKAPPEEVQINMTEYKTKRDEFVIFSNKIKKRLKKLILKLMTLIPLKKYIDFHLNNEINNFKVTKEKIKKSKTKTGSFLSSKPILIELEDPIVLNKKRLMNAIAQIDAEFSISFNENQLKADMETYTSQLISLNALRTDILFKNRNVAKKSVITLNETEEKEVENAIAKAKKLAADKATEAITMAEKL